MQSHLTSGEGRTLLCWRVHFKEDTEKRENKPQEHAEDVLEHDG